MRKPTIYEALWEKLGREPTHSEAVMEVKRILEDAALERAALPRRRKKRGAR